MRINSADRKLIKNQIRGLVVAYPKTNQSRVAKTFGISRVTVKKWLEEIRDEQIKKIGVEAIRTEMWRLEQRSEEYIRLLGYLQADVKHLYDKFPHVLLGIIRTQWSIQKELFELKLDLYSRELSNEEKEKIRSIDQKIGIATVVNVSRN